MIRKASIKDIDEIEKIYNRIFDLQEQGAFKTGWVRGIYPIRQTAESALDREDLYVYEQDSKIVATGIINKIQVEEYKDALWNVEAKDEEVLVMHTLCIDQDKARSRYGETFIEYYENLAKEMGCKSLRLDTNEINERARMFYKKLGYSEVSIVNSDFNGLGIIKLVCLEKSL